MSRNKSPLLILMALLTLLFAFGCGNSESNPTAPSASSDISAQLDSGAAPEAESHGLLGVYDIHFDPETENLELVQSRGADAHFDVSAFMSSYFTALLVSWDPVTGIMVFNMTMWNPTALTVYDLRCLLIAPPASVYAMLNADDYTDLFNPYGPGVVNPFKAYGKTVPARAFTPSASLTEQLEIRFPLPIPSPLGAKLLIECSFPTNCEEPYEISNQIVSNPINATTSAHISLDAFDHQNDLITVRVDTTPITGGPTWLATIATPDTWEGDVINSAGAAPGIYKCLITAESHVATTMLYDYLEIEVIPDAIIPTGWTSVDYNLPFGGCELDLGVIADPGGPRDSNILMVTDYATNCDSIYKHDADYAAWNYYVDTVTSLDPDYASYSAYPIRRIDTADDGAFSFTNDNWSDMFKTATGSSLYFAQIWNVLDNAPYLHTGPYPDDSRFFNDLMYDSYIWPVDVCDDFELGQYAVFTSGVDYTPEDITFLGVLPNTYTQDHVLFHANLEPYVGLGAGEVNPERILGIDVIEGMGETDDGGMVDAATLYILEQSSYMYEVEVFQVLDTNPDMNWDHVHHVMTISIDEYINLDYWVDGRDIEILPVNTHYKLNPADPTVCVLVSYYDWYGMIQGDVFLYNARTGAFLESIGTSPAISSMPEHEVQYLDTDDGDWEIHVTSYDVTGAPLATIFSY